MFAFIVLPNMLGEKLVNFLVEPKKGAKWPNKLPRFKSRQEAIAVCKDLCRLQFIHRSEKRGKGDLVVSIYIADILLLKLNSIRCNPPRVSDCLLAMEGRKARFSG